MNNFSQEEISAAKSIRESIINGDTNFSVKGAYMAGEICMWDELRHSPSGVDVLVGALERIEKICLRDAVGIEPMQKHFRDIYELATTTLAQYNAVEPDRTQSHLEKMCIRAQELFTEKKDNPKNKKHGLQDAWNNLANALYDANQFLNKKVVKSQSPQTPIDREPEGIDGMGNDPL